MFAPHSPRSLAERLVNGVRAYARFVRSCISQGHREDFYELKDQRFLGTEEFIENIHKDLNEMPSFVYAIAIEEIVSEVSSVLNISKDLFYSTTRNHQGSLGRAVVAYFGKELGGHSFREISDHFHRDPVVMSQGIKRLEKKIRDDETIAKAIAKLRGALTRNRNVKYLFT